MIKEGINKQKMTFREGSRDFGGGGYNQIHIMDYTVLKEVMEC